MSEIDLMVKLQEWEDFRDSRPWQEMQEMMNELYDAAIDQITKYLRADQTIEIAKSQERIALLDKVLTFTTLRIEQLSFKIKK